MKLFQCTVYNTEGIAHYNLVYNLERKKEKKKQAACAVLATSILRVLKHKVKLAVWGFLQNVMLQSTRSLLL